MHTTRRFWTVTLGWAAAGAALLTLHALWRNATGDFAQGWFGFWATLRVFPGSVAFLLPLAAFAGGLTAADPDVRADAAPAADVRTLRLAAACGLVAALALAYGAPWGETAAMRIALPPEFEGRWFTQTPDYWQRVHHRLLAEGAGDATRLAAAHAVGLSRYLPLAGGAVAACAAALGALVGARTRGGAPAARAHRWGVGAVLLATVYGGWRAARVLAGGHAVPAEGASLLPVVGPALLLLALLWSERWAPRAADAPRPA